MSSFMSTDSSDNGEQGNDGAGANVVVTATSPVSTVIYEGARNFQIMSEASNNGSIVHKENDVVAGEAKTVSVRCASFGQDGETLINTIEVSTEELMSMGQMNAEEVEFVYSPNIEFQVEGVANDGNNGIMSGNDGMQMKENREDFGVIGYGSNNVAAIRFLQPGPRLVGQRGVTNPKEVFQVKNAIEQNDQGEVGLSLNPTGDGNGDDCSSVPTLSTSFDKHDGNILPSMPDVTVTIDGNFQSAGVETTKAFPAENEGPTKCDVQANRQSNIIFVSDMQGLEYQIPAIIETATLAHHTLNTALTTQQNTAASSSAETTLVSPGKPRHTLGTERTAAMVQVDVSEGASVQLQKFYCQAGLCRVCLLTKDNLTSIFEDVTIDSKGWIENARGPNSANKFHLIAALKTLLDVEVDYNDGLPDAICLECYDQLMNFSVYRKKIAIGQAKLKQILEQVKDSNTPTFIPSLGETDIQRTDIYKNPVAILKANNLLKKSQYSHLVLRNLSDRLWDKIFSSLSSIVGYKSGKLKSLEHYTYEIPHVSGFFCHTCNSTIHGSKEEFAQHQYDFHGVISPEDVLYPCDICGNSYPLKDCTGDSQNYSEHWLQHFFLHGCTVCNKKLPSTKGLWVHKKSVHGQKKKVFSCEECETTFSKKAHLDSHKRTHDPPSSASAGENEVCVLCSKCNKRFSSPRILAVHLSTVHGTERPWKCDVPDCHKRFKRKEVLITHKETVHMNLRKYECEYCHDTFKSRSSKNVHILRHKNEKNYICTVCDKQFFTSNGLKSHQLAHQDVGSFPCDECTKVFKRVAYLEEHKRTHTGEKPFICPICNRAIRMKSNYFKHLRIHKKKNESS